MIVGAIALREDLAEAEVQAVGVAAPLGAEDDNGPCKPAKNNAGKERVKKEE